MNEVHAELRKPREKLKKTSRMILSKYAMQWTYKGKIVEELPEDCEAFVYPITKYNPTDVST